MGFIVGLDITMLGVTLLWHGTLDNNFKYLFFGLCILLIGDGILVLYDNKYRGKDGRMK